MSFFFPFAFNDLCSPHLHSTASDGPWATAGRPFFLINRLIGNGIWSTLQFTLAHLSSMTWPLPLPHSDTLRYGHVDAGETFSLTSWRREHIWMFGVKAETLIITCPLWGWMKYTLTYWDTLYVHQQEDRGELNKFCVDLVFSTEVPFARQITRNDSIRVYDVTGKKKTYRANMHNQSTVDGS